MRSKSQKRDVVSTKAAILLAVIAFFGGGIVFMSWVENRPANRAQQPVIQVFDDCVVGAPRDCVRGSIERAKRRDFQGFYYCACVTSSGLAKGYMAADSKVYQVDDTDARAERTEPLGNDNPALVFPVGVKHR